ncbi:MAG: methyltransferase domain-containing protein [Deltaproteobacteria bacterium]|nr:methyltransferase domain-containing protein [Deltaproteobacteria bacterium]MBW2384103.1 methyltransferase domain-containing protein [Deltaproteobacteria bacterium]
MRFLILIPIWLSLSGCGGVSQLDLSASGRDRWQRPDDVVEVLALRPGESVADLGSGDGYFLPHLSRAVGPEGRVYAVEVEADLVEQLTARVDEESLENVEVILGTYDDPQLPDRELDTVLIVNTYHHIEERPAYFARLATDLSDRGRVVVIEPNEELSGVLGLFVEEGHASVQADIEAEMRQAGYRVVESTDQLPIQIFVTFEREPPAVH